MLKKYLFFLFFAFMLACQPAETSTSSDEVQAVFVKAMDSVAVDPPALQLDSTITADYLMGKFDPAKDKRFVKVVPKYASRAGLLMRKEAYDAFLEMAAAAEKEGIQFKVLSAARNFNNQKRIWEGKWKGARLVDGKDLSKAIPDPVQRAKKILEWSSMPGSSRHHWGTDIDINALNNEYFAKGKGLKEYEWLKANAESYGFCQPYSPKGEQRPEGYNEEKWHWTYMPISEQLTEQARLQLKDSLIKGFAGAEAAGGIGIVKNYVLGINHDCR